MYLFFLLLRFHSHLHYLQFEVILIRLQRDPSPCFLLQQLTFLLVLLFQLQVTLAVHFALVEGRALAVALLNGEL